MKKAAAIFLCLMLMLLLVGCGKAQGEVLQTDGTGENILMQREYAEDPDGTWEYGGHTYKYRLEISGKGANAAMKLVYLSNVEDISFEQALKGTGLSSDTRDYFDPDEAVLVKWWIEE